MASLLRICACRCAPFEEKGLRVLSNLYDPSVFGDAAIVLASDDIQFRVLRDRGEVTFEVSSAGEPDWHNLEYVLECLTRRSGPADANSLIHSLSDNFEKVVMLMVSGNLSKAAFLAFEEQKAAALIKGLFPQS